MNPLQLMELCKDRFTPNDQLIYNAIVSDPSRVIHMTTSVLAEACGVSQPALSRFVKGLGYPALSGFPGQPDLLDFPGKRPGRPGDGAPALF